MKTRLNIEGTFSNRITGGSMCFVNLDAMMDEEQSLTLHEYVYKNSLVNQWCPNYGWSRCSNDHLTCGEIDQCHCGDTNIQHYERVVGYLVKRNDVNQGREIEMLNRVRHQIV